jgi:hypothetical protein
MTWRATGSADIARHVIGCHATQEISFRNASDDDDVARDICVCPYYMLYAVDGEGAVGFLFLGRLMQGASETVFLLLLIMLAKGWTICCRKISARGRVKIAIFGTVYACVWMSVVVWYYFYADPASTLHIYQSPAGRAWRIMLEYSTS